MCGKGRCCCSDQPKARRVKPAECTPEQIRECHGDTGAHPCTEPDHPCQCEAGGQTETDSDRDA